VAATRMADQARNWINSTDSSFEVMCHFLSIDASQIRSQALRQHGS
jgi:hypothetical protein